MSSIHKSVLKARLARIFWLADWLPEEALSATMTLAWGLWILHIALELGAASSSSRQLQTLLPLEGWGALGVTIGLYGIVAVLSTRPGIRLIGTLARLVFWLFLGYLTLFVTPSAAMVWIYGIQALYSAWASIRLMRVLRVSRA